MKHKRFNFGVKHLFVRLLLTFVSILLIAFITFPFLTQATNLTFEQKASIGGANIWKIAMIYSILALPTALIMFWKKRFRLTAVLLMIAWVCGMSLVGFIVIRDKDATPLGGKECVRNEPYEMPSEIRRALNLLWERGGVAERKYIGHFNYLVNYWNCIDIKYADIKSKEKDTEGLFFNDKSTLDHLQIEIDSSYKDFDDLTIALLLAHELKHAEQFLLAHKTNIKQSCVNQEAEAFTLQRQYFSNFNKEEQRSVTARMAQNINLNPIFLVLNSIFAQDSQISSICQKYMPNEQSFNKCYWERVQSFTEAQVRDNPHYQKQCGL